MIEVQLLGGETNAVVLQLSNRKNPSICIQSDTLATLASSIHKASLELVRLAADEEVVEWAVYANNVMYGLVRAYNDVASQGVNVRQISDDCIAEIDSIDRKTVRSGDY